MSSATNSPATATPTATAKMSGKSTKTKVITLRLSPESLAQFPSDTPSVKQLPSKTPSSSTSTPAAVPNEPSPSANPSESTPAPTTNGATPTAANNNTLAPPTQGGRRKGVPGPKPGSKRSAGSGIDGVPKPRGKPGPKKKARIGELMNGDVKTSFAVPSAVKMNPKASQGAINANLRALDRSGKPCRRWERKPFMVKSFTGVAWSAASWASRSKGPTLDANGEVKSDTTSSSDAKLNGNSSALASEKSGSNDMDTPSLAPIVESSPAPVATPV